MKIRQWHFILLAFFVFSPCIPFTAHADNVGTGVTVVVTPDAPSNLTAVSNSPTQVTISWTDNAGGIEDGFHIERKIGAGGTYVAIGTTGTGVATYVDNSAAAGTTYFYRVDAFIGTVLSSYSNEASVTTSNISTPPSGGGAGGGGGGGGAYIPPATTNTKVTIVGWAYPLSMVTILRNGVEVIQTIAGTDGVFSASISDFPAGSYNFYLYALDSSGRRSPPFTFSVMITAGASTNISNIFLAPTLGLDKQQVRKGDPLVIFGQALPNAPVTIVVDSAVPVIASTTAASSGIYVYDFDTNQLAIGSHLAKSATVAGNLISGYSLAQTFTVGDTNVAAPAFVQCPVKGDFNGDCKVDLVDFSMLAYWYGQSAAPAIYRLDNASTVDLRDFSILAYYWTG